MLDYLHKPLFSVGKHCVIAYIVYHFCNELGVEVSGVTRLYTVLIFLFLSHDYGVEKIKMYFHYLAFHCIIFGIAFVGYLLRGLVVIFTGIKIQSLCRQFKLFLFLVGKTCRALFQFLVCTALIVIKLFITGSLIITICARRGLQILKIF